MSHIDVRSNSKCKNYNKKTLCTPHCNLHIIICATTFHFLLLLLLSLLQLLLHLCSIKYAIITSFPHTIYTIITDYKLTIFMRGIFSQRMQKSKVFFSAWFFFRNILLIIAFNVDNYYNLPFLVHAIILIKHINLQVLIPA